MESLGRKTPPPLPNHATAGPKKAEDKRFAPRRPGQLPAQVYLEGAVQSISCLILDMSSTGARLGMRAGWDNGLRLSAGDMEKIRLVIRHDRVMYDCKMMRRSEAEIGVKFLSAAKPITKSR